MAVSLLSLVGLAAALQAPQASVVGVIREADSGSPLASALVLLGDLDRAVWSGADGRYGVSAVPAGPQHLTVSALGYAARTVHALVPVSGTLSIDVSLSPAPIPIQGFTVEPMVPVRGAEPEIPAGAFPDRALSVAAIRNHPLLAEPDALRALGGGEVVLDPEAPSGIHVRGGAADHTGFALDGIPIFDPVHAAGLFSASLPETLSGVVSGAVRDPGARFGSESSLSTTHAATTLHGPLSWRSGGYVLSLRSGFPGAAAPRDGDYVRGETGDALVKLEARALGGDLALLVYSSENELTAGTLATASGGVPPADNSFWWGSGSLGATWRRSTPSMSLEAKAWRAASEAGSVWGESTGAGRLDASREEIGVQASVRSPWHGGAHDVGVRALRLRSRYDTATKLRASTPVATVFAERTSTFGTRLRSLVGASLSSALGAAHFSPRAQLAWLPSVQWTFTVAGARTHQFTQSLSNPESVVRHVFPAGLAVAAGTAGVPVPRSDQVVLAASWEPQPGIRFGAQGYARVIDGLVLVAPAEVEPFSTGSFVVGEAAARGLSLEASSAATRYAWVASYGWQRVREHASGSSYAPAHGSRHLLDAGVITYPTATISVRLGLSGVWGRSSTDVAGPFEWEACNLIDLGCEFAGTPRLGGALGSSHLPGYARVDVGARKHWHLRVAGRESVIGLFGSVTNVFGRANTLTLVRAQAGEAAQAMEMRPRSPLVIGLDWRF